MMHGVTIAISEEERREITTGHTQPYDAASI